MRDSAFDSLLAFAQLNHDWRTALLARITPEPWGDGHQWLDLYCQANFTLSSEQDGLLHDPKSRFVLWRVGTLATTDDRPIYGYFVKNTRPNAQPYFLVGFVTLDDGILRYQPPGQQMTAIRIVTPPVAPTYAPPLYPPTRPILSWQHIMEGRGERLRARLPNLPDRALRWLITGAVVDAHKNATNRAVPAWRDGHFEWLLPLHIVAERHTDAPDFVAPIRSSDDGRGYVIPTVLEPWMAYPHARAVTTDDRTIRTWITPTT